MTPALLRSLGLVSSALGAILAAHAVAYFGISLLPDSATRLAGILGGSDAILTGLREQFQQRGYLNRLGSLLVGDMGNSVDGVPIVRVIGDALALSAPRLLLAALLLVAVGAAVLRRPPSDDKLTPWLEWAVQIPPFVWCFIGFIVVVLISDGVDKSILSVSSFATVLATMAAPAALLALQTRSVMRDLAGSDFAVYMKSLGIGEAEAAGVVRSAAIRQLMPSIEKLVMWLTLSLIFAEMLLSMPGLGLALTAALSLSDVDALLGLIIVLAVISNGTRLVVCLWEIIETRGGER